jgi:hypothetical protein
VKHSEYYSNLKSLSPCTAIYSKDYQHGTLFAMKLEQQNYAGHMDTEILKLDKSLRNGSTTTKFTSISDVLSGKLKSFGHNDHMSDEHYKAIFSNGSNPGRKELAVHPDVKIWRPEHASGSSKINNSEEIHEFDVVKKRKAMDAESPTPSTEDSPVALAAFEDFEHSVLSALKLVQEDELINFRMEMLQLEYDMSQGKITTSGGTYFAWSSCLNCMKIGATRRDDPHIRLRELSRHVTVPFTLVGWIPTPTPFRLESATHAHFAAKRIRNAGAGTEFFNIDAAMVEEYVKRF